MAEKEDHDKEVNTVVDTDTTNTSKDAVDVPAEHVPAGSDKPAVKPHKFKQFLRTKKGKVVCTVAAVLVIAAILFAIPTTRYGILGTFLKKNVQVTVVDSLTMKPVSRADITLGDTVAKTGSNGEATLENIPVGEHMLKVAKKYYKDSNTAYTVPVFGTPAQARLQVAATGRQVIVSVVSKITQAALAKAIVTVKGTSAVTDSKGKATIVLPADRKSLQGTVRLEGYNQAKVKINVTEQPNTNTLTLTPHGTVYYLSKQTGKINVMKANLDGSSARTVVEGTGNEVDRSTVLLAARDWKYMALSAKRDATKVGQLYLVDAASGTLKIIDEGDATFQLIGWSDHRFIYVVNRNNKDSWDGNRQALKSYDAETGNIATLDESGGTGSNNYDYQSESIQNAYILDEKIVYTKVWSLGNRYTNTPTDKKSAIMSINPNGGQKQRVKEFSMQRYTSIEARLYEPQEVYFKVSIDGNKPEFYEYEAGTVKSVTNNDDKFYSFYPTYLISPSDQKTFWHEPRDGKNALFIGDKDGQSGSEIATQSEYTAYGWYSDEYVLLSKNGSELFVAPANKPLSDPVKVTNYHKPDLTFPGYGYGYGGQ